jgi:5'-nucleotidase
MKKILILLLSLLLIGAADPARAESVKLTILHTNDLHSHLLGFSPEIDYTWETTGDDDTVGGWARLATLIETTRQERSNPVLVLDAGDFMMGSLFHLLSREQALELRLLKKMGYDLVSLGNHEFDLKPDGLARILASAQANQGLPDLVLANARFSPDSDKDDSLEAAFEAGLVRPYRVVEKGGVKIGVFGLLGKGAGEVAPFASPVKFDDAVETAKKMVDLLRNQEKVDMVICLSHSGLSDNPKKSEDEILAKEVPGLDVIISGHTHTRLEQPLMVGQTIIVQTGCYGAAMGRMDLEIENGRVKLAQYELVDINDQIPGNREIAEEIARFQDLVQTQVLAPFNLEFQGTLAQTTFDLTIREKESNLGNLIADALRWSVNRYDADPADPDHQVVVAVVSNGVIRDDILVGRTGRLAVCDAFRAIPLGIGWDGTMGYPMVSFYLTGPELKKAFEILTSIYPMKGGDYYLQYSGARVTYNPHRVLFDRVTGIWLGDEVNGYQELDYSDDNQALYRVAADIYNSTFLKIIGNFTWNILTIVPKDRQGRPITDLAEARVDMDADREGVQELKEWWAVLEYIKSFADTNGDNVPDVPDSYRGVPGRQQSQPSWNPYHLLRRGNYLTWTVFATIMVVLGLALLVVRYLVRRQKRK